MRKKYKKWTYELLHKTALMYKTRYEFQKGSPNAYNACRRREILNEVCSHMENVLTNWTDEMLFAEAKKYKTRYEFVKGSPRAYEAGLRRNLLNEICSHMRSGREIKWTDKMLFSEAKKYNTRSDFFKGSPNAYAVSCNRALLDETCKHMEKPPHRDKPHCVYLIEIFTTNYETFYYVGQTCNLARRLREHRKRCSPVFKFINNNPILYKRHHKVKDNLTYKESIELERDTIKDLINRGIKLLNKDLYRM